MFSVSGPCRKIAYVESLLKQVTNVSLVLKDSDTESEDLVSVSNGQKTDSSKVVSFIGI